MLLLNRHLPDGLSDGGKSGAGSSGTGHYPGTIPAWMRDALREIDERPERGIGLAGLAERAAVTPPHFSRAFKRLTGMNVTDYINAKRIVLAKERLLGDDSVGAVAERCGFDSLPHFHRTFKAVTGLTPGAYKRQARGIRQEP